MLHLTADLEFCKNISKKCGACGWRVNKTPTHERILLILLGSWCYYILTCIFFDEWMSWIEIERTIYDWLCSTWLLISLSKWPKKLNKKWAFNCPFVAYHFDRRSLFNFNFVIAIVRVFISKKCHKLWVICNASIAAAPDNGTTDRPVCSPYLCIYWVRLKSKDYFIHFLLSLALECCCTGCCTITPR